MAERIQKQSAPSKNDEAESQEDLGVDLEVGRNLRDELDDLLDEIDEVLESNAEDFVRSYVQKGGE